MTAPARTGVLLSALLAMLPTASSAQPGVLHLVSQSREVRVDVESVEAYYASCIPLISPGCTPDSTTVETVSDGDTASGSGPFVASASPPGFPGSIATQDSEITTSSIRAAGTHAATSTFWNSGGFPITFQSESHDTRTLASVSFDLDAPSAFVLSGSVTARGLMFSGSTSSIRLIGPGGVVAEIVVNSVADCVDPACVSVGPEPIDASGILEPGSYSLEAVASGNAGGVHSTAGSFGSFEGGEYEMRLELSVPIPAIPFEWRVFFVALLVAGLALAEKPPRSDSGAWYRR